MCSNNKQCGSSMTCVIANNDIGGWVLSEDNMDEYGRAYVVGPDAGVLCCGPAIAQSTSGNKTIQSALNYLRVLEFLFFFQV